MKRILLVLFISVLSHDVSGVSSDRVSGSAKEGDSVTLNADFEANKEEWIKWYFNDNLIAQITGDQSQICTDDECKERFRDRLMVDHMTGSLTITKTRNSDSGVYKVLITSRSKIFDVSVIGIPADEQDTVEEIHVKKAENVTLSPDKAKNPSDVMTWYFNDIRIAEITGDQSQICTDDECKERFSDRLKVDHQTGSLTITNTDSGEYRLEISRISRDFSVTRVKKFIVTVTGLSSAVLIGICAGAAVSGVLLISAVTLLIRRHTYSKTAETTMAEKKDPETHPETLLQSRINCTESLSEMTETSYSSKYECSTHTSMLSNTTIKKLAS